MSATNLSPPDIPPFDCEQETHNWYTGKGWSAFPFQMETLRHYLAGKSGLLNAPTGSGKTYALWIPVLMEWLAAHPDREPNPKEGLQVIWITPLRALAQDILEATRQASEELGVPWQIETRTGDTTSAQRAKQRKSMPQGMITTPESLHVLFASKDHASLFKSVKTVIVDEWHELLGSKRGVQMELALARLRRLSPGMKTWGISATIGNLGQAMEVLLGKGTYPVAPALVKANIRKEFQVESVIPETMEKFPWAGHLGTNLIAGVLPILLQSKSTLIFTNTRAQCEIWYHALLEAEPDLAGNMAMHHGSLSAETRSWVEQALHAGTIQVVVCTSSLDLGVDFRPVDAVVQVGGPKGVARFIQRAGRGGHRPGAISKIYFVPTHSLELIEAAALREAVREQVVEDRVPMVLPFDVLIQYLITLAVSDGFQPGEAFEEVKSTFAYQWLSEDEFGWVLDFITTGGASLHAYDEYQKVDIEPDGTYKVLNPHIARLHRLSIGTIVGDVNLSVKYLRGSKLGTVEESFITQLNPGDTFWFAGKSLELIRVRGMDVLVKKSTKKLGKIPRWMGSRMPLSSQMARILRLKIDQYLAGNCTDPELAALTPTLALQQERSVLPSSDICLMEYIHSREGYHVFIYPFEGRVVHEIMGALLAWRIARLKPLTFSIAMNDYGLELLSDQPIPIEEALAGGLLSSENLEEYIRLSINQTEMASRRFREISTISGLVFQGYPGKQVTGKHLQASSSLLFKVFQEYDPHNLLLRQAYTEVLDYQVDGDRLHRALDQLSQQHLRFVRPTGLTPFCFPIMADRMNRQRLSTESLADRIARMELALDPDKP